MTDHVQHTFIYRVQLADDSRLFGYFNNKSLHGCPETGDTGSSFMRYLQFNPVIYKHDLPIRLDFLGGKQKQLQGGD